MFDIVCWRWYMKATEQTSCHADVDRHSMQKHLNSLLNCFRRDNLHVFYNKAHDQETQWLSSQFVLFLLKTHFRHEWLKLLKHEQPLWDSHTLDTCVPYVVQCDDESWPRVSSEDAQKKQSSHRPEVAAGSSRCQCLVESKMQIQNVSLRLDAVSHFFVFGVEVSLEMLAMSYLFHEFSCETSDRKIQGTKIKLQLETPNTGDFHLSIVSHPKEDIPPWLRHMSIFEPSFMTGWWFGTFFYVSIYWE